MAEECVFCKIARKEAVAQVVYESRWVICFLDIDPINEGHVLIVPKMHCSDVDLLPDEYTKEIMEVSKRIVGALKQCYDAPGYSIMQNGGEFCDFGHYHMHVFPRYHQDGFGWTFGQGSPKAYCERVAENIKQAMG